MTIGFRLRYQKSDDTIVAFRIAEFVQNLGYDVSFISTQKAANVHTVWDKYLHREAKIDYYRWTTLMSHIYYIGYVHGGEVIAAKKAGAKTILVCLWDEIEHDQVDALELFDTIICPNHKTYQLLKQRLSLENLEHIPWDPGVPLTQEQREINPDRMGFIWPLDGSQSVHQEPKFLHTIETVLKKCPNVWMTVTYSSTMANQGVKELRRLYQVGDGKIELVRNPTWDRHQLLFGHHDLTIWPTLIENVGLIGLSSLYMGVPVLAFDHPVIGEMIKDGRSGILIPCELRSNWFNVPYVKPDYQQFGQAIIKISQDAKKLSDMRGWTVIGLKERREIFNTRMARLLSR